MSEITECGLGSNESAIRLHHGWTYDSEGLARGLIGYARFKVMRYVNTILSSKQI